MAGMAIDTGVDAGSTGPLIGGASKDGRTIDVRGLLGAGAMAAGLLGAVLLVGLLVAGLLGAVVLGSPVDDGVADDADGLRPPESVAGSSPADCGGELGAAELDAATLGSPMEPAASEPGEGGPDWLPQDPRTSSSAPISTNNPELHLNMSARLFLVPPERPKLRRPEPSGLLLTRCSVPLTGSVAG